MNETQPVLALRDVQKPDWPTLVDAYGDADLNSPRRSTVPLLAYWHDRIPRFGRLLHQLGLETSTPPKLSFEHPVGVAAGHGKSSITDLMIIAASTVIAIEAKYTEPMYETVRAWLGQPPQQNRCTVLGGWLSLINKATATSLTMNSVLDLPYQLVHRTASACFSQATHRAVLYQVFDAAHRDRYLDELRKLRALAPEAPLALGVLLSPAVPSDSYLALCASWDT